MKRRIAIKIFLLEALAGTSGEPMPREALITQTQLALSHLRLTVDEIAEIIEGARSISLVLETKDDITETQLYTLTPKGEHALRAHRS